MSRLFLGMLLVYGAVAGGHLYTADDWSRFHAARSFLLHLSPELPDEPHVYGVRGAGGRIVSHFPPGLSIAVLPLLAVGHAVGGMVPHHRDVAERAACSVLNQVVVAWLMTLLYRLLGRTAARPAGRFWLTIAAAFGTLAFPYAKHFWAEPLQAALLIAALLQLAALSDGDRRVRRFLWCASALAGAFLVKYETVVPAAVVMGGLLCNARPRGARLIAVAAPWAVAALLAGAYNAWRFGSPFDLGYGGMVLPKASPVVEAGVAPAPMVRRLLLLLASPGQGLFVFVPLSAFAFALAIRQSPDRVVRTGYLAGFATFLLYVVLDRSSTWCWGPRYLFTSMILWWPALAGIPRRLHALAGALAGLGGAVALLGVLVNFHDAIEEIRAARGFDGWEWVAHVQREPASSPLLWHARLLIPYARRTVEDGIAHRQGMPPVAWRHRHLDVVWLAMWAGGSPPVVLVVPLLLGWTGLRNVRAFARSRS